MKTQISNKDLETILSHCNYDDDGIETIVELNDDVILINAELGYDNSLFTFLMVSETRIVLTEQQTLKIAFKLKEYRDDVLSVKEPKPMTTEEWKNKLEYFKN
tara:strand:- start:62 stop:370 length:309 start_codon:yes stop_codon:yes gene_type:complete